MKKLFPTIIAACLLLYACNNASKTESSTDSASNNTAVTDDKAEDKWIPIDSAMEMKAWMEYGALSDKHKMMATWDGNWDAEQTFYPAMGAPGMKSKASCSNKMTLDGKYQMSEYKGDYMGMPFNGMSITGFDNYKKQFVTTWMDNMGSGIMKMEGPWDEASKSMTLTGKMTNPANGKECNIRQVYKIVDDNTQLMEMYGPDSQTGQEYKTMEVKFVRKK